MPITFACSCGKTLRVKDDLVGRWVRCPACKETAIVPEAEMQPAFEVIEDDPPPPPPRKRVKAESASIPLDDEEPPPRPRSRPDQEYDGPRKARRKKKSRPKSDEKPSHFAMEKGIVNSGVAGGMLAMVVAVVWFVVGMMNDILFYYPPVLFLVGLVGFFRGLLGGGRTD